MSELGRTRESGQDYIMSFREVDQALHMSYGRLSHLFTERSLFDHNETGTVLNGYDPSKLKLKPREEYSIAIMSTQNVSRTLVLGYLRILHGTPDLGYVNAVDLNTQFNIRLEDAQYSDQTIRTTGIDLREKSEVVRAGADFMVQEGALGLEGRFELFDDVCEIDYKDSTVKISKVTATV